VTAKAAGELRLAVGRHYDRVGLLEPFLDVPSENGSHRRVSCSVLPSVPDAFRSLAAESPYDAAEMSVSFYAILSSHERPPPFVAIPVFLSRAFRLGNIFVRADSTIERLTDMRGAVVGLPEYAMTMGVWIRGILSDRYGIKPDELLWKTVRDPVVTEVPDGVSRLGVQVSGLGSGDLWAALLDGRIDVAIGAPPSALPVRRVVKDYEDEDRAFALETGIFPIMHLVVIRREVCDRDPEAATVLFRALCMAKASAMDSLVDSRATLAVTLPFVEGYVDRAMSMLGRNWWPYGISPNRICLETLLRYSLEQGLLARPLTVNELFEPSSSGLVDDYEPAPRR
jgi:4,5-dihydroxyphthalate decarboxylase